MGDFMAILRNAIQCKICGDIIESISVHDFKTCSCGSCSVDGGHDYLRRCAKSLDDFVDLSEFQREPYEEKQCLTYVQIWDGNGRVGRLIMFKECLKYNIVPFIIEDNLKMFYYRGLKEWDNEKGYLTDTCLTAQDRYKAYLDYFRIAY